MEGVVARGKDHGVRPIEAASFSYLVSLSQFITELFVFGIASQVF
jgi:hypothetical protein